MDEHYSKVKDKDAPMNNPMRSSLPRDLAKDISKSKKSQRLQSVPTEDPGDVEIRQSAKPSKPSKRKEIPSLEQLEGSATPLGPSSPSKVDAKSAERGERSKDLSPEVKAQKEAEKAYKARFVGRNLIQYGLWAHYMTYGAVLMCIWLGVVAILWEEPETYGCKLNGQLINSLYLFNASGFCNNIVIIEKTGLPRAICCDINSKDTVLQGNYNIGALYLVYGFFLAIVEEPNFGFGLWYPNDSISFRYSVSPMAILNIMCGIVGLAAYSTSLAGACLICLGLVQAYAVRRGEAGDGGRLQRANAKAKEPFLTRLSAGMAAFCQDIPNWNPYTFFVRIYNEDKLSSYIWVFLYLASNVVMWVYVFFFWVDIVEVQYQQLKDATMDLACNTPLCKMNRKILRYGPLSPFAAFAKASGGCLNYNCALILFPVIKMLLRRLNNVGVSFSSAQHSTDYFAKFLARPLTRYVPLQKNIEFHKLCAFMIFLHSWVHFICHYVNLIFADASTTTVFNMYGWIGTAWLTGSIVTLVMFIMYSAAPDVVRHSKFEIFFYSHHLFTVFFLVMFIHGPVFFYWTAVPVVLYLAERYYQSRRGNCPFIVSKVEWISPVMSIYFRPVFKEDFVFKEGQYLYLNCPHISVKEWHPFTISSAYEDLNNGPRIDLITGEEVVEVPRPASLPAGAKWNKYCLVSQDYRTLSVHQLLDKSDTGFMDFISCHIKVHGLDDPVAKSWTRKFKEYLELLNAGGGGKFPFYFSRRDHRGEITIGKQFGPDGSQIIRVDGPHSAPSEHYTSYGTVMLVGAGIGLTPCASILSALTKYRWRKNFNPEIVHLYWVVRQNEVESFQWLMHMLTELSFELKKGKETHQIERKYYCEINIYVTAADKSKKIDVKPLHRASRNLGQEEAMLGLKVTPSFSADQLYAEMMNPTVDSKGQIQKMKAPKPTNRFQDVWVWNGRPNWDEIFKEVRDQRQHSDIGVCFCGAPVIGADLRGMCEKYSNVKEDCVFTLHKENF